MKINRQQYMMIGLILLFVGIQFRMFDSYVLTDEASAFIEERFSKIQQQDPMTSFWVTNAPRPPRTLRPPQWVGWALLSLGGVLVMHSLALKQPE